MTRSDDVAIGSSWRYGNLVYVIRARRPVESGYPAWSARHLVLAVPRGEDPHPLDWIPDTWLRRYLTPVAADSTRRPPEPVSHRWRPHRRAQRSSTSSRPSSP